MSQSDEKTKWPSQLKAGLAIFVVFLLAWILWPTTNHHGELAGPVKCASNLRQIGQGLLLYSNENRGAYPPNLAILISTVEMTSDVFICPSSNDEKASGPTTKAVEEALTQPGHCSYTYVGNGLTNAAAAEVVLAFETANNHGDIGRNVLFGDGHVERLDDDWIKRLEAAVRERGPSTRPVTVGTP